MLGVRFAGRSTVGVELLGTVARCGNRLGWLAGLAGLGSVEQQEEPNCSRQVVDHVRDDGRRR